MKKDKKATKGDAVALDPRVSNLLSQAAEELLLRATIDGAAAAPRRTRRGEKGAQ